MASEKITALVEEVKGLTVLELSELVHTLEEVFGVSAAAAAVAAPAAAPQQRRPRERQQPRPHRNRRTPAPGSEPARTAPERSGPELPPRAQSSFH